MQIRAAVFHDYSLNPSIEDLELSGPREGEVLVRLTATGVCHTDIKTAETVGRSPRPVVLGHEGAGVVDAVGAGVTKVAPGDHVVMSFGSPHAILDRMVGHHRVAIVGRPADWLGGGSVDDLVP